VGAAAPEENSPSIGAEIDATAQPGNRALARRIIRRAGPILVRVSRAVLSTMLSVFKRNPRTALAAAASILILGAIWVTQPHGDSGKHSVVTNAIGGSLVKPASKNRPVGGVPKPEPAADPTKTANARPDVTAQPGLPAPARSADDESLPGSLANAPSTELGTPKVPEKSATGSRLVTAPKDAEAPTPAPAPGNASATLLAATAADTALEPPLPVAQANQGSAKPAQPGLPSESPAEAPVSASASQPIDPVLVPAPAAVPAQVAHAQEPVGSQLPPSLAPAPEPAVGSSSPLAASTGERKPIDGPSQGATNPIKDSPSAPKVDQPPKPNEPAPMPALAKNDEKKPEPPSTESPQPLSGAPEPLAPLNTQDATAKPAVPAISASGAALEAAHDSPGSQALPVDSSKPTAVPVARPAKGTSARTDIAAQSSAPDAIVSAPSPSPEDRTLPVAEPRPPKTDSRPDGPRDAPTRPHDPATDGWISLPNTAKLPSDGGEPLEPPAGESGSEPGRGPSMLRDPRAHAARNVTFEQESPTLRSVAGAARTPTKSEERSFASSGASQDLKAGPESARVESVPHLVERGENYWTISRLYYDSGRYYRALWKANSDKYPDINVLHVGDTIMIPPVEDLDPAYILGSRSRATLAAAGTERRPQGRENELGEDPPSSTSRTRRATGSATGIPSRLASRTDSVLDLPQTDGAFRRERAPDRDDRRGDLAANVDDRDSDVPETRTAARPRRSDTASPRRPVYKVRPYDTLRSIARDTLDDARRAGEILELNDAVISDPNHLVVGQILELPEDARSPLRRSASRN
jgi:nucleoid-associated protein YgaU